MRKIYILLITAFVMNMAFPVFAEPPDNALEHMPTEVADCLVNVSPGPGNDVGACLQNSVPGTQPGLDSYIQDVSINGHGHGPKRGR